MTTQSIFDEQEFETKTTVVQVMAKNCLYFAWAANGYQGPANWPAGGWEQGIEYRPQQEVVKDYGQIHIRVTNPDQLWQHGATNTHRSTAAGRDVSVMTDARYKSPTFRSQWIIQEQAIKLNGLVVMFGGNFSNPPTKCDPVKVQYVGLETPLPLPIPPGAEHIYLGMHDGYEWSNNSNVDDNPIAVELTLAKKRRQ